MTIMKRNAIRELKEFVGQEVIVMGWVDTRRDHGKIVFLDIRDESGKVQGVDLPNHTEAYLTVAPLRPEWVVEIKAKVNKRPEKMINSEEPNGDIELEILGVVVLNKAETLPIDVSSDGREIGEEPRLKFRYLDLRRPRMQKNLRIRHRIIKTIRD